MNISRKGYSAMASKLNLNPQTKALTQQLDSLAPRFELDQDQVQILLEPKEFYENLKSKISLARKRVFLSSLYIGKSQDDLIECISIALKNNPDLKVHILTDALRGTREAPSKSSASLLAQLMKSHEAQVDIRMYHTPHLNGIAKKVVPKRFNEGFGLQHMKIYGFDDEVILSGANLSTDYFTNRQDRYYVFKSRDLTDYYFKIQDTVSSLSYKLIHSDNEAKFKLIWPLTNPLIEPSSNEKKFLQQSSNILKELLRFTPGAKLPSSNKPTYVYPVSQLTPLFVQDHSTEKPSVLKLLDYLNDESVKWTFTAGYFNMLPEIKEKLLKVQSTGTVITASPWANGFYKSKGVSGYLPEAYLYLSKLFLKDVHEVGKDDSIILREWKRGVVNTENGWSYHAKGLWATFPKESLPGITIIGSSNYTRRAYNFDLETNAIVITADEKLKQKMADEVKNIQSHTIALNLQDFNNDDRKIGPFVICATKILGKRL